MMIIPINETWRIESDERQWIVNRYAGTITDKTTGEQRDSWKPILFYSSLESAIDELFRRGVRRIDSDVPAIIQAEVQKLRQDITAAIRNLDQAPAI